MLSSQQDSIFMMQAIEAAEKARYISPPNPWVGCVIVKEGQIIAEGFTHPAGGPHAEVVALNNVKDSAEGSTAYITLEPCNHYGLTPPCTDAIIKAKIARVVIAIEDPDPRVAGQGIRRLQRAGIMVTVGIQADMVINQLLPYLHQRKTHRPFCVLKSAMSIDGRVAAVDGSSKWITNPEARLDSHYLRAASQAILIGSGTALKDQPKLNVRNTEIQLKQQPLRVVLDTHGQIKFPHPLLDTSIAPTLICTSDQTSLKIIEEWKAWGVEVACIPFEKHRSTLDIREILHLLFKRGIIQVLIEGGSIIHSSFLAHQLVDKLIIYVGPKLLGNEGLPLFKNLDIPSIDYAHNFKLIQVKSIGDCVRLDYECI